MGKDLTSSRALKSYAIAGASAGLMNKLSDTFKLPSQPKGWEQHVQGSAVRAAVSTPLNIFIGDCKPEEAAFNGLKCFVANSTGGFISENIGDVFDAKKINEITRYLAHGGGGAVTGAILSIGEGDILRRMSSAAVSAMTAEVASDLFSQGLKDQEQSLIKKAHQEGRSLTRREIKDFGQVVQVKADIAKIVGTACSLLVGRDVGTAFMAANNAVEYNYAQHVLLTLAAADVMLELYTLTHPEEAEALKQRAIQAVAEKTGFTPEAIEQSFHGMMMAGSLAGGGKNLLKGLGTSLLKSEVGKRVRGALRSKPTPSKVAVKPASCSTAEALIDSGKTLKPKTPLHQNTEALDLAQTNSGRLGKQAKLRELMHDPKVSSTDRGWLKQEVNAIQRKSYRIGRDGELRPKTHIRVPPGKELAHKRGKAAKDGYSYEHSDLQGIDLHRLQHKHEGYK